MSQPRRSIRKKRQTQLTFTPLPSSSPATSQYPEEIQRRAASVRYDHTISSPTKKRRVGDSTPMGASFSRASSNGGSPFASQKVQVVIPSPSKSSDQLPTPAASSQVELNDEQAAEPENENPSSKLFKQITSGTSMQPIAGANTTTRDDGCSSISFTSEEDDDMPVRSARRTRPAPITLSTDNSPQPQTPEKSVTPMKRPRLFQTYTQAGSSPLESDSEAPTKKIRQKLSLSPRSTRTTNGDTRAKAALSETEWAKKAVKPIVILDGSEESSSEDIVITPVRKRKTAAQTQSSTRATDLEEEEETSDDLRGELEDLQETGTPLRHTRTRDGPIVSERSKRQQKLQELRRRRAGIRDESQEEDERDDIDDIEEVDLSESEPIHYAMRRGGNLDQYEDDFVDDDDDDKVGVDLGVAGVPLHLTYHSNKKPFEHFKTEIEWMVHNKLNPAFDRYDEIYELAHRKIDDEVQGYAGSKFISSVWGGAFNKALKERPDLSRVDVPTMLEQKCEACRRTNHPPKHKITFSGRPYNRTTLETVENDEDDEEDDIEDSSDDEGSSSQEGESFFVGRFCCANAEMGHALQHWRYALNQSVLAWLAAEGQLDAAKIVERENLRQKKRQKATNKIVDGMEDTGVMKMLYKQFKENLAAARDAKPERFSKGH